MAGLVPAIHVFACSGGRRGCPAQGPALRFLYVHASHTAIILPFPAARFWSKHPARGACPPPGGDRTRGQRALFLCPVIREPMPKRSDINSILIIGAGPIVIGQACQFDYFGTP